MDNSEITKEIIEAILTPKEKITYIKAILEKGGGLFMSFKEPRLDALQAVIRVDPAGIEKMFPLEIKEHMSNHLEDKMIDSIEAAGLDFDKLIQRAMHRKLGI